MSELGLSRNASLSYSGSYFPRDTACAAFNAMAQVSGVADNMPLFTALVAGKLPDRVQEQVRRCTVESVCGKLDNAPPKDIHEKTQFAKTQKRIRSMAYLRYGAQSNGRVAFH